MMQPSHAVSLELDSKLRESGYWRKWIPKDGACFFRAAADIVFGTQVRSPPFRTPVCAATGCLFSIRTRLASQLTPAATNDHVVPQSVHLRLREKTAAYLEAHRPEFEQFLCLEDGEDGDAGWEAYIANLRKPAFWAGEPEIRALASVLGVRFKISTPHSLFGVADDGTSAGVVSYTAGDAGALHHLFFSGGNHYDCLYPAAQEALSAMCQSVVLDVVGSALGELESPRSVSADSSSYYNAEYELWRKGREEQLSRDAALAVKTDREMGNYYRRGAGGGDAHDGFQEVAAKKGRKTQKKKAPEGGAPAPAPAPHKGGGGGGKPATVKPAGGRAPAAAAAAPAADLARVDSDAFPSLGPKAAPKTGNGSVSAWGAKPATQLFNEPAKPAESPAAAPPANGSKAKAKGKGGKGGEEDSIMFGSDEADSAPSPEATEKKTKKPAAETSAPAGEEKPAAPAATAAASETVAREGAKKEAQGAKQQRQQQMQQQQQQPPQQHHR